MAIFCDFTRFWVYIWQSRNALSDVLWDFGESNWSLCFPICKMEIIILIFFQIVFGIWKIKSLSLILRELWLLLGSLNKNTIFRKEELATDLVESGWMKHSWFTLQVWPHNFPFALSGNKPIPVLSVAEQIFIIDIFLWV